MKDYDRGMYGLMLNLLSESEIPLGCNYLSKQCHTTTRIMGAMLGRAAKNEIPGFARRNIRGKFLYAIGEGKFPKHRKAKGFKFDLPEDMFRGWFNPLTGITGVKLGL